MRQPQYEYRRRLPHIQGDGPIHARFSTYDRKPLPPKARDAVLDCCKRAHGLALHLYAAVVMPNHVHILFTALRDAEGWPLRLPNILGRLRSAAAHAVNKVLQRSGPVWQEESFDHVLRSYESLESTIEYIRQNPVKAKLSATPEEYRWLYLHIEKY
jgi:REP element-mobilizing transposase RayT